MLLSPARWVVANPELYSIFSAGPYDCGAQCGTQWLEIGRVVVFAPKLIATQGRNGVVKAWCRNDYPLFRFGRYAGKLAALCANLSHHALLWTVTVKLSFSIPTSLLSTWLVLRLVYSYVNDALNQRHYHP